MGSMVYDMVVIGGGPAGLTAAIYATRYKMSVLVLYKEKGGTLATAPHVENYPGLPGMTGMQVMEKLEAHAKGFDVELKQEEVIDVLPGFKVKTKEGNEYEAKTVVFATGTERRKLNVPGEAEFLGKGVSYCATCDAPLFRDAIVGVVGGSDSAAKEALMLTEYAKKVYILYRKEKIRSEPTTTAEVDANKKIEIIPKVNVVEIFGDGMMKGVKLDSGESMELEGLFIEIGGVPASVLAEKLGCKVNEWNEIDIDWECKTACPGVFAAGDVTPAWKQAIVAAGFGAVAAFSAYKYVKSLEAK